MRWIQFWTRKTSRWKELLDEDEIIQECKALNNRLINFLRDKAQVEQLLRYIVDEVPEDSEKKRSFKFPFIACEIFTCEIEIILRTLVEDDELMGLLFSFVKPDHPHSTLLAGYFSKVVICLMLRKTAPLMNYVQAHPDIVIQLVDLIGITSIMEVLMRLIGADETIYSNFADTLQWLENTDVLEMIVDKFSSSDSPEVHANAAEILSAVTRCAPPALAAKISSPSFVGRLFYHALEESRPKSVLVHSLSIVEFISVLLTIGSETAERELISQSAIKRSIDLFFQYPYNNFLHHHVENIVVSCLEERNSSLSVDCSGRTFPSEGKEAPRIGNIGHITRTANKLIQLGNSNSRIQSHLQDNSEWVEWQTDVLVKRNEAQGSHERDDEDVYFDDESAEVVISSLRLGDDQDSSSLFTNSNWFTFDGDRGINDRLAASVPSSSPNSEDTSLNMEVEVLTSEATAGTELQLESVCLENDPAEVAIHTDGDKLLFTEDGNSSKEPEASEQPVDPQGEQIDTEAGDAAEVSGEEMGSNETEHDSGMGLQVEGQTDYDSGKGLLAEGDLSVEVDDEKKSDVATAKE
ncbi:hypothetical protein PR202_gb11996 [Eleusine coracana subsp. coracana]|uniref:SIT4 phosphatase-associated family protein n=1 Tax=Eleusine coracana subsp. coracana TaxID=191504 RepID=A0AAV5EPV8_ELECO|nr:hypothetical protein PR202_gb11996 [Eleusine coracana subsp. coracana]